LRRCARGARPYLCAAVAIALLPLVFTDSYWRTNLIICALNVMLAIGLDFVLGYAGQLNLGQSAFFGLGAYVSTLLITRLGVPFWVAFAGGVAFSGLAGIVLSLFAMRLRGHYLAIASLGFAVITYQVLPQLDQPHAGTARHLRDSAPAADRACRGCRPSTSTTFATSSIWSPDLRC